MDARLRHCCVLGSIVYTLVVLASMQCVFMYDNDYSTSNGHPLVEEVLIQCPIAVPKVQILDRTYTFS